MSRALKAGEVLDIQGDLIERMGDPMFRRIMDALGEMEYGRSGGFKRMDREGTTPTHEIILSAAKTAEAYRVTHDMSMVVEHAASQLDDLDQFKSDLAPTGCGFVSFDRPLPVHDVRGKTMLIHFLLWGHVRTNHGPAIAIFAFNDTWRQADMVQADFLAQNSEMTPELIEEYQRASGRWATVGFSAIFNGQRLGPALHMPNEEQQAALLADGDTPHPSTNTSRYIHALWLLMNQTVARVEPEGIDRKSKRRAERRKLPPKVSVIRLRREQGAERAPGESNIEWAHRWVVRGFWRWQPCGETYPGATEISPGVWRSRIWINPHVRGPADKPIVQSQKLYSLER